MINDDLLNTAKRMSRVKSKREVFELALKFYIKTQQRKEMLKLFGKVNRDGNLEKIRSKK